MGPQDCFITAQIFLNSFFNRSFPFFSASFTISSVRSISPNVRSPFVVLKMITWKKETVAASVLGTAIGFVIAMLLSFIRSMEPSYRDRHAVQYLKYILVTFEKLYVTVIRGTPMMVRPASSIMRASASRAH